MISENQDNHYSIQAFGSSPKACLAHTTSFQTINDKVNAFYIHSQTSYKHDPILNNFFDIHKIQFSTNETHQSGGKMDK